MAFTHDASTSEGLVRTLIDDTNSTDYEFEDAEITATLDVNEDDVWRAAADLCRALAAKYAKGVQKLSLGKGDISIDNSKKAAHFSSMADRYEARSGGDVVEYIDSVNVLIDGHGIDQSEYMGDY